MAGIDTGSSYLSMLGQTNSLSSSSAKKLQNTLSNTDKSTSTDDEMMDVCKDFESYFVQKIYEEMKKTVHSEDDEGEYMQYFGDMYTQAIAEDVADNGTLGLAQQLYESMKRNS